MLLPVCERSDDKTWCISKILIWVQELSITDVNIAMVLLFIPAMPKLRKPLKCLWGGDLWTHKFRMKQCKQVTEAVITLNYSQSR